MNTKPFSEQLREAVRNCGESRYSLWKRTGILQSTLCKFMAGGSMSLHAVDTLVAALGLELKRGKRQPKRKQRGN